MSVYERLFSKAYALVKEKGEEEEKEEREERRKRRRMRWKRRREGVKRGEKKAS